MLPLPGESSSASAGWFISIWTPYRMRPLVLLYTFFFQALKPDRYNRLNGDRAH